jgi:SPP1 gp7 family putative phage head morphogenesis protein
LLAEHKGTLPKAYWDHLQEQLQTLIEPWLLRVTQAGIAAGKVDLAANESTRKKAAPVIGIAWDLVNQDARRQAQTYTYDLVRGITDNTRERLQKQVDEWIAAGNAFPDLVERIKPLIPDLEAIAATALQPDYRARLIAMTESTRAYADGNNRVWEAAGYWGREWETAVDERVCPVCGALHQQRAKLGEDFAVTVKGKRVVVKNPPAHPGCRCGVKPVVRPERSPTPGTGQERGLLNGREVTIPSLPRDAGEIGYLQHFYQTYGVSLDLSSGYNLRPTEAEALNTVLGALPPADVRSNPLFEEFSLAEQAYGPNPDVMGMHQGNRITLYPQGRDLQPHTGEYTQASAFEETLLHEVGESRWRQLSATEQAEWVTLVQNNPFLTKSPSEQFAVAFSYAYLREPGIPPALEKWVRAR